MRYLSAIVLFCVFVMAAGQTPQPVVGVWHNDSFGFQMTLILNADGSGEFAGEPMTYQVRGSQIIVLENGFSTAYDFAVNGDEFKLSGGDLDSPMIFTRSGSCSQQTPVSSESTHSAAISLPDPNLIGIWSGQGETIEFDHAGNCKYLGQTYAFQAAAGQITLSSSQGQASFSYQIKGDDLILSGNNQRITYTRGTASQSVPANRGSVATELVGSWCYMNTTSTYSGGSSYSRCIALNGDGTYTFHAEGSISVNTGDLSGGTASQNSDSGTWYVQGDRIFYQSNSGQNGSYQLRKINHPKTGDPMIVLDGDSYVTKYQKAPWR